MSVEADVKPVAAGVSSPDHAPAAVIRKVAVLGAGTMGSRIAAHLANAGLPVVLLDIPAPGGARSAIASQALDALAATLPYPVRPRCFLTHFFMPPRYMSLVEILPTSEADPAAIAAIAHFA